MAAAVSWSNGWPSNRQQLQLRTSSSRFNSQARNILLSLQKEQIERAMAVGHSMGGMLSRRLSGLCVQKENLNPSSIVRGELTVLVIVPNVFGTEMSRAGGPKLG